MPEGNGMTRRIAVITAILALALIAPASQAASPEGSQPDERPLPDQVATREERAALGLPTDDAIISSIVGTPADVGTPEWGIVMTATEAAEIDLLGRMEFGRRVKENALP